MDGGVKRQQAGRESIMGWCGVCREGREGPCLGVGVLEYGQHGNGAARRRRMRADGRW